MCLVWLVFFSRAKEGERGLLVPFGWGTMRLLGEEKKYMDDEKVKFHDKGLLPAATTTTTTTTSTASSVISIVPCIDGLSMFFSLGLLRRERRREDALRWLV
jgi:hypothetical protein